MMFVTRELRLTEVAYREALSGGEMERKILRIVLEDHLAPNVAYLRRIGRLPEKYKNLNPRKRFKLPD